jgi:hypothetical protein
VAGLVCLALVGTLLGQAGLVAAAGSLGEERSSDGLSVAVTDVRVDPDPELPENYRQPPLETEPDETVVLVAVTVTNDRTTPAEMPDRASVDYRTGDGRTVLGQRDYVHTFESPSGNPLFGPTDLPVDDWGPYRLYPGASETPVEAGAERTAWLVFRLPDTVDRGSVRVRLWLDGRPVQWRPFGAAADGTARLPRGPDGRTAG